MIGSIAIGNSMHANDEQRQSDTNNLFSSPHLLADIGSTYARFALEVSKGEFQYVKSLPCADYKDFYLAIRDYLDGLPNIHIEHAAVAIANPVDGDLISMTNYHWHFSIEEMRQKLELSTLLIVNDFTALAMALPRLGKDDVQQIGGGEIRKESVKGLLGSGSGLGVSGLIPAGDGWISLGSEGGHTSFSPRNEREIQILQYTWKFHEHVSFERLVSGPGLELIYQALLDFAGEKSPLKSAHLSAPEITQKALEKNDKHCVEALDIFCSLMGTAAANLAVTLGAKGGIYIGGGIVPKLGDYFEQSNFRTRFEEKGRFSSYVTTIPTFVIVADHATFIGASAILEAKLRTLQNDPGSALLSQIRRILPSLSPAELRVAEHVLAHARAVVNDPIAEIARAASVSQPTVIRFCRSLGCEGLSDFKLRLASGLTGTVPVTHVQVTNDDSALELGAKVLGNTASSILQVRNQLNREMIEKAIELIVNANHVEFYAIGHYGVVANDAQYKFLRLGIPCTAHTDSRLQMLSANVLTNRDVVVVSSGSGKLPELVEVAEKAKDRGALVIAITTSHSPLIRRSDVALIVDHVEDVETHLPMISRILHLLVIDMLAVGVAMRKNQSDKNFMFSDEALDGVKGKTSLNSLNMVSKKESNDNNANLAFSKLTLHSKQQ